MAAIGKRERGGRRRGRGRERPAINDKDKDKDNESSWEYALYYRARRFGVQEDSDWLWDTGNRRSLLHYGTIIIIVIRRAW